MIQKLIQYFARKRALRGLRRKYTLEIAVNQIMKDWIKVSIIERKQEGRRKELVDKTKEVKEIELFYKWLRTQK